MVARSVFAFALLLLGTAHASRQLLAPTCTKPDMTKLHVVDSTVTMILKGTGRRVFWCNDSKFEYNGKGKLHGDTQVKLESLDGQWTGKLSYGAQDGQPRWTLRNKVTGKKISVQAEQKPQVRRVSPSGQPLTWDRRKVVKATGVKANYVIRSNTKSGPLPTSCKGDIDAHVPLSAIYKFVACF